MKKIFGFRRDMLVDYAIIFEHPACSRQTLESILCVSGFSSMSEDFLFRTHHSSFSSKSAHMCVEQLPDRAGDGLSRINLFIGPVSGPVRHRLSIAVPQ